MEAIEGDATHETSGAARTCYQFVENCYLKLGKSYQKSVEPHAGFGTEHTKAYTLADLPKSYQEKK